MPNTRDHNPAAGGLLISDLGTWGTGKSRLALTAAKWAAEQGKKAALAALLAPELDGYAGCDIDYEIFDDPNWQPRANKWQPSGYNNLLNWLSTVRRDPDVAVVIVDPATEVSHLMMHEALKMVQSDDPKAAGEYGVAYLEHDRFFRYFMESLQSLQRAGKHVICTGHTRMKELEGSGEAQLKNVMGKTDLHFDEKQLPAMLTNDSRQSWGKYFSLLLYSYTTGTGTNAQYWVRSVPSTTAPAKRRIPLKLPDGVTEAKIPNDFKVILQAVKDAVEPKMVLNQLEGATK